MILFNYCRIDSAHYLIESGFLLTFRFLAILFRLVKGVKMKDKLERIIIDTANNMHMMNEKELKKRFFELRNILTKRALDKLAEALSKQMGVSVEEIENNSCEEILRDSNNNWIDLNIDNLPERFFTRDDIEIELLDNLIAEKQWLPCLLSPCNRYRIIDLVQNKQAKYRYRIQKNKEPMRITQEVYNILLYSKERTTLNTSDPSYRGRQIIIIK